MKNLFLLPTSQPSRLYFYKVNYTDLTQYGLRSLKSLPFNNSFTNQNIYITNSEEIKKGDWCYLNKDGKEYVYKCTEPPQNPKNWGLKIILTTDKDLIEDGVQPIPDEFLEWFVNNTSCEEVEVESLNIGDGKLGYIICKPQEEPKEETLEEVVYKLFSTMPSEISTSTAKSKALELAKWQQEQDNKLYSEEEVLRIITSCKEYLSFGDEFNEKQWFEQFKKK